jgi:CrcB protein
VSNYLLVFLGGGLGSMARYFIAIRMPELAGTWLPWGTLSVNVAGSFAIGLLGALAAEHGTLNSEQRTLLMTGVLGGFTTYSAFSASTCACCSGLATPGRAFSMWY